MNNIESAIWLLAHSQEPEDRREFAVLYWKSKGLKHKEIAAMWGYSEEWVQRYMTRAYVTFGIPKNLNKYQKYERLEKEVFPKLKEFIEGNAQVLKELPPPPTEPFVPEPGEDTEGGDPDEGPIVKVEKPEIIHVPRKKEPKPKPWLLIAIIAVLVGVIGYLVYRLGQQSVAQEVAVIVNTQLAQLTLTKPPQAAVIVSTAIVVPTQQPSSTPLPTSTPYPTNTPKPGVSLPFKDDFSNGINPPWSVYSGKWLTTGTGATITIADDDPVTGALILDDSTLTNYHLRVKVHSPGVLSACQGDLGVVVRYQADRDQNLMYFMNSASRFYWGYTDSLSPSFGSAIQITDVVKANIISDFVMELEASGNNFTARIDGAKYDSFSLTGYESGGVALVPVCGCPGYCPSFSDFSLEPLP